MFVCWRVVCDGAMATNPRPEQPRPKGLVWQGGANIDGVAQKKCSVRQAAEGRARWCVGSQRRMVESGWRRPACRREISLEFLVSVVVMVVVVVVAVVGNADYADRQTVQERRRKSLSCNISNGTGKQLLKFQGGRDAVTLDTSPVQAGGDP